MAGKKITLVIETEGATQTLKNIKEIQKAVGGIGSGSSAGAKEASRGIADLAFGFNNVVQAAQTLAATLAPAYDLLIGSNEKLNQQLLQSAATITATSDVFQNGIKIEDVGQSIDALQTPLLAAIKEVEKETQKLVGVTSEQTSSVFNTILSNVSQLNNQSKQFPDSIQAAAKLAPGLVATLGSLQLPIEQASQEIRSILTGDIGPDSAIAKALNLSREQINAYKAQGILVDELIKKFAPFLSANAKAALSIGGITSNIKDIFEILGRTSGSELLNVVVDQLNTIYQFLEQNQEALQNTAVGTVGRLVEALKVVIDTVTRIGQSITAAFSGEDFSGLSEVANIIGDELIAALKTAGDVLVEFADVAIASVKGLLPAFKDIGFAALELGRFIVQGLRAGLEAASALNQVMTPLLNVVIKPILEQVGAIAIKVVQLVENAQYAVGLLTGAVGDSGAALETYGKSVDQTIRDATRGQGALTAAILARQAAEAGGTKLTAEQAAAEAAAVKALEGDTAALRARRDEIEQTVALGPAQKKQKEQLLAQIDKEIGKNDLLLATLEKTAPATANSVKVAGRELEKLGTITDQLKKKVDDARRSLSTATTSEEAAKAAKDLLDLTQQQLDLGDITRDQAIANAQEIANNERIPIEQRLAAQQALSKFQEQASNDRVQQVQAEQQKVQQLVASGQISDAEGEAQLTALKAKELETRLENIRAALKAEQDLGRGNGQRAKDLKQQEADLVTQVAEARATAQKAQLSKRLDDIEREGRRVAAATEQAESERLLATQRLVNEGVLTERQASQEKLQITRDRIQSELAAEQDKLAQLRSLPSPTDPDERERLEQQIRDSVTQTARLQLSLLENERQAQQALADAAIQAIRDQSAEEQRAAQRKQQFQQQFISNLEREKAANQAASAALQTQSDLLQSQVGLQQALQNLRSTTGQIEIDRLEQALQIRQQLAQTTDAATRQELERQLSLLQGQVQGVNLRGSEAQLIRQIGEEQKRKAEQELKDLELRQIAARRANELEIQRNQLAAERAVIEARIAEIQARQQAIAANAAVREADRNVQAAQQIVDPEERARAVADATFQRDSAVKNVGLVEQQVELAGQVTDQALQQVDAQAQLAENSRLTLNAQQATERATARAAAQSTEFSANLRTAAASAQTIARSLGVTSDVQGFKDGGNPSAGQVAWVGEAGPELVKFGANARVWSNSDSMRIAQRALSGVPSVGAIASGNMGDPLLKAVNRLNDNLSNLEPGVQIGTLQQSVTNQVPQNERAIAQQVEQANLDLLWELKAGLRGGRFGRF